MEELDLKEITSIFWRKKFTILIIILLFAVIGIIYSYRVITPDYKASTTLILGRINSSSSEALSQTGKDTNQITQSEIAINSNLVSTYSELIKSKSLTQKVKDNLNIDIDDKEFRKNINVSRISETELIEITVTNRDGKLAADIANEIAKVFSDKIEEIYNISNVYIIDRAVETNIPYNINHFKDIVIFIILGIAISLSYSIIYSILDTTIKSAEDIEKEIGIKNLISIPVRKENKKENYLNELITYNDAKSINSEVFKTLRTNVQFSNINNKENKVMLVTSCFSSEGKSYISANLATVFAQAGKKVILIDADMRRGRQSRIFNLPNELGLSNYLSNLDANGMEINERVNKYINETEIKNLNVITSGNIPPNPSELLTSNKLPELIKELSIFYDLIIFDGAPVLPIADSLILARMANSTILVSLYNKTKKDELLKAKKDIQNVGGRIIGTVLNKVPNSSYEYESKYYYEKEEKPSKKVEKNKLKTNIVKNKIETTWKKIKLKIDEKLKSRIKNKIKLLCEGTEKINVLNDNKNDDKTVKEYEIELKRLENEKKEFQKQEQLKKKKEQERLENEKQKAREELVKNKEIEIVKKNNEKIKEENKKNEEKQKELNKIEEAKKQALEELERRKEEKESISDNNKKQEIENKQKEIEEKEKLKEEKRKNNEAKKIERQKKFEEIKGKINKNIKKLQNNIKIKKDEWIKKFEEKKAENKIKSEKNKQIREEMKAKQKELKAEKEKAEREERARKAEENEIIRQREFEEKEKLRLIKEEERKQRNIELENEKQILLEKKLEEKIKRAQAKEEKRKFREEEKQRQKEEERIKEQILEDNLYPKTKYNKDL